MKKIAAFLILAYAVLIILLTWPVLLFSMNPDNTHEKGFEFLVDFGYWIFLAVLLIIQAGLLFIPIKVASNRPVSRKNIYLPIILSGFLFACLVIGVFCSLYELFEKNPIFEKLWESWFPIYFGVFVWFVWGFIFSRLSNGQDPKSIVLLQCKRLLQGSIIALLVAVPSHIIVRGRDVCCAGILTFVGITFGLSVMLLSFGPGIYFLYAERWRKLQPKTPSNE